MTRPTLATFRAQWPAETMGSGNALPAFSQHDIVDVLKTNSKPSRQFPLVHFSGITQTPDRDNVRHFQPVLRVLLAMIVNWMGCTPNSFIHRVLSVFLFGSKPKMVRVDAGRIVAAGAVVENAQSFWNWTFAQNPSGNMGANGVSASISTSNVSVTKGYFSSSPEPTGIGLVDLGPEATWKRLGKSLRSKVLGCNLDLHNSVCAARVTGPAALLFSHNGA